MHKNSSAKEPGATRQETRRQLGKEIKYKTSLRRTRQGQPDQVVPGATTRSRDLDSTERRLENKPEKESERARRIEEIKTGTEQQLSSSTQQAAKQSQRAILNRATQRQTAGAP
ncbi:Hypothetical_protein [Hexamita inflata]|uniref:Hypothetical_protein n=1 Tax=Hexamita inflata TaxID=28002 RepID=A0AA86U518_9EUKA|nr:Hypothetical protein HINF_LOCUS30615 [Hexamita inflata]